MHRRCESLELEGVFPILSFWERMLLQQRGTLAIGRPGGSLLQGWFQAALSTWSCQLQPQLGSATAPPPQSDGPTVVSYPGVQGTQDE